MLYRCLATPLLLLPLLASLAGSGDSAPAPAALLLAASDLPPGFVRDDAIENADATARDRAYGDLITASAFAAYRTEHQAVTDYVARLHSPTDAATFLSDEATAIDHAHNAARVTLPATYGDRTTLAYQARGDRGEEWVTVIFAAGVFVTSIGVYDGSGEQQAIDTASALAAVEDTRLRAAAASLAPEASPTASHPASPAALRIIALDTSAASGQPRASFASRSSVYWRVTWRVGAVTSGATETIDETVRRAATVLHHNALTDRPYAGDNTLADHLALTGAPPGSYSVTISIAIGRLHAQARRAFSVTG